MAERKGTGFTVIETVVSITILTILSAVTLISFTALNEGGALARSARELALAIRRTQNVSLAVTSIEVGSPPVREVPPAVGVRLVQNQSTYLLFADRVSSRDFKYSGASEKVGKDESFLRAVKVATLTAYPVGTPVLYSTIHILFSAPEATVFLSDENGISVGDRAEIELATPSGRKKTIVVRTSGQVSVY